MALNRQDDRQAQYFAERLEKLSALANTFSRRYNFSPSMATELHSAVEKLVSACERRYPVLNNNLYGIANIDELLRETEALLDLNHRAIFDMASINRYKNYAHRFSGASPCPTLLAIAKAAETLANCLAVLLICSLVASCGIILLQTHSVALTLSLMTSAETINFLAISGAGLLATKLAAHGLFKCFDHTGIAKAITTVGEKMQQGLNDYTSEQFHRPTR